MPRIPLFNFQPKAPESSNVRADPGMYNAEAAAGQRVGSAIAGAGDVAAEMGMKLQAADAYRHSATLENAMDSAWNDFQTNLNPSTDQTKWAEQWQKQFDAVVAKATPKDANAVVKATLEQKAQTYRVHSTGQINLQAKANGVEKGRQAGDARAETLWENGDAAGAQANYEQMANVGLINPEEIPHLMDKGKQKMEQNQANALITGDPFAALEALKAKDANGKFTTLPNIPESQRQTLLFRAYKASVETRSGTMKELLQAKADALAGAGDMPDREQVDEVAKKQGISPKWVENLYKPEAKFNATNFATVRSQALSYDPTSDANGMKYAETQQAIYDAHLPPAAQTELLEDLKKKANPKSELNTPVAKEAGQIIDENFRLGVYGKYEVKVPDKDSFSGFKTEVNPKVLASAQQKRAQAQTALAKWLADNPAATHAQAQQFLNEQSRTDRARTLWTKPINPQTGKASK